MTQPLRRDLVSRDVILKLLTDVESARVSTAETKAQLADGADYVDLDHLERGVQHASGAASIAMGDIVPRSAVSVQTWTSIMAQLTPSPGQ